MHMEWWCWIIAGFCLIGLELFIPLFISIWFGVGALVVGVFSGLWFDVPLMGQIVLWLLASSCFTFMWFTYLKPKSDRRAQAGNSQSGIVGVTGVIVRGTKNSSGRGIVKFRTSILGADKWGCHANEKLQVGDRVRVINMEGKVVKVEVI